MGRDAKFARYEESPLGQPKPHFLPLELPVEVVVGDAAAEVEVLEDDGEGVGEGEGEGVGVGVSVGADVGVSEYKVELLEDVKLAEVDLGLQRPLPDDEVVLSRLLFATAS